MAIIFIRWIDRQHRIETISYQSDTGLVERESCFSQLRYLSAFPSSCTLKQGQKLSKMKTFFKEKISQSFKDCFSSSGGSMWVHTRRQVAATCRGDTLQRQIRRFVCTGEICENLCRCNRILSPQQVAQIQSDLIFCDLLQRQNSVAETKIFTKILQYTRSDLSLRRVASPCCCNQSPDLYTWSDMSLRRVAATCRLVCTDLQTELRPEGPNKCFETVPPPPPHPLSYLKVWIGHCHQCFWPPCSQIIIGGKLQYERGLNLKTVDTFVLSV